MAFIRKEGRTLDLTAASEQASGSASFPEYATGRMSRRNSSPERMSSQPPLQSLFLFSWEYLRQIPCGQLEISANPRSTAASSPAASESDPVPPIVPETYSVERPKSW